MLAEDIFADVDSQVILLNGEIVRRAFHPVLDVTVPCPQCGQLGKAECPLCLEIVCSACEHAGQHRCGPGICCQYWTNPDVFWMFNAYRQAQKFAESARMRMFDPLTLKEKQDGTVWRIRQNRFAYMQECTDRRDELRARLKAVWPCSQCTDRRQPWLM